VKLSTATLVAFVISLPTVALARPKLVLPHANATLAGQTGIGALEQLERLESSLLKTFPVITSGRQDLLRAEAESRSALGGFYDPVLKSALNATPEGKYTNNQVEAGVTQSLPLLGANLQAGYRLAQGDFAVYDGKQVTGTGGEWKIGLDIPLLRNALTDSRRTRIETTEIGISAAQQGLTIQILDSLRNLRSRFWSWVSASHQLVVQQELLDLANVREKQLQESVRLGDAPEIDLADNRRAIAQREAALVQAQRTLDKAALDLALYVRDDSGQVQIDLRNVQRVHFPEPKALTDEDLRKDLNESPLNHPELQRLSTTIEQSRVEKRLADNQMLPKLDAGIFYHKETGELPPTLAADEVRASILFEFPIPNRAAIGRADSAETQVIRSELGRDLARDRLRLSLIDSAQSLRASIERVNFAKKEVEQALLLEKAERSRFANGMSTLFLINLREQATADARQREITAIESHFRSWAEYLYFAGKSRWP
jgi:cobalt-zinc-cadmium efflux system outer membrane protein